MLSGGRDDCTLPAAALAKRGSQDDEGCQAKRAKRSSERNGQAVTFSCRKRRGLARLNWLRAIGQADVLWSRFACPEPTHHPFCECGGRHLSLMHCAILRERLCRAVPC